MAFHGLYTSCLSIIKFVLNRAVVNVNFHFLSANVTVSDSPFIIQRKDAQDVVDKSLQPGSALPVEPIGMYSA